MGDMSVRRKRAQRQFDTLDLGVLEAALEPVAMVLANVLAAAPPRAHDIDEAGALGEQRTDAVGIALVPTIKKARATASPFLGIACSHRTNGQVTAAALRSRCHGLGVFTPTGMLQIGLEIHRVGVKAAHIGRRTIHAERVEIAIH